MIVQAYFHIGVSQHRYFNEKKCVAKTPLGQIMLRRYKSSSTLNISIGSMIVQAYFNIGVSQHRYFKEKKCVAKTPLGQKPRWDGNASKNKIVVL